MKAQYQLRTAPRTSAEKLHLQKNDKPFPSNVSSISLSICSKHQFRSSSGQLKLSGSSLPFWNYTGMITQPPLAFLYQLMKGYAQSQAKWTGDILHVWEIKYINKELANSSPRMQMVKKFKDEMTCREADWMVIFYYFRIRDLWDYQNNHLINAIKSTLLSFRNMGCQRLQLSYQRSEERYNSNLLKLAVKV